MISDSEYNRILSDLDKSQSKFFHKMKRLRSDLQNYKKDVEYIKSGNKIVYVSDFTEINAYVCPEVGLSDYLFDIHDLSEKQIQDKKIKRWYRLRELFYGGIAKVIVVPPHLEELNKEILYYMQRIVIDQYLLQGAIKNHQKLIDDKNKYDKALALLGEIERFRKGSEQKIDLMNDFFDDYSLQLASMTYDNRHNYHEGASGLERITNLLKSGGLIEYNKYDWIENCDLSVCVSDKIKNINIIERYDDLSQIVEMFYYIRRKRILSNVVDALALLYIDEINKILKAGGYANIQIHFVTSALSVSTLTENVPTKYIQSYVRHPKFLPALMADNSTYYDDLMMSDIDKIIGAIDPYIKRCKSLGNNKKYIDKIEGNLKEQISDVWRNIENKMFLKEVSLVNEAEVGVISINNITSNKNEYVVKTKELLNYFHDHRAAFNKYIHYSYGFIFDQLVVFYINRMIGYERYDAFYIESGKNKYPFRILWKSKAIRSIVELNNKELVSRICSNSNHEISIRSIIETIADGGFIIKDTYEIKLIKAMCLLTAEQWHLADIICRSAINSCNQKPYEGYYLLSLIQRKFAFDKIYDKKYSESYEIYQESKRSLFLASEIKKNKDYRFIFADATMKIEEMYFPDAERGCLEDISPKIDICISQLEELKNIDYGEYGEYLQFRCYQILTSFYFMWYIGFYGEYKSDVKRESVVETWYNAIKLYDKEKPQYKDYSVTIDIIENACPLILKKNELSRKKYIEHFDGVYSGCKSLHKSGFYKMLVHDLKVKLYDDMSKRFRLKEEEIIRWPEMKNCDLRYK